MNKVTTGRKSTVDTYRNDELGIPLVHETVPAEVADIMLAALIDLYDATTANDPERIRKARSGAIYAIGKATQGD